MSGYSIPNMVEKRPTGERALNIYSRLLSDRIVDLGTELDDGVTNVIVAQLLHMRLRPSPMSRCTRAPGVASGAVDTEGRGRGGAG